MNEECLVKVEGVSKKFCRHLKRSLWYGVKDIAGELFFRATNRSSLRKEEFWALDEVSFELRRGECLGLIGRNGAGKSTLLKLINGLIKPDKGRITVFGKAGSLIELGTGFNPVLSGRENIYINASVLGIPRKVVDQRIDDIIDFAEIREFINTPIQSYSSGMKVRLGFAIATAMEPDVLLLDEVLAVGDRAFRVKCYNRISELQKNCAVIFVSHNMADIARVCTRVMVLRHGKVACMGSNDDGINYYNSLDIEEEKPFIESSQGFEFRDFFIDRSRIGWNERVTFRAMFNSAENHRECTVRVTIMDRFGMMIGEWKSKNYGKFYDIKKGENIISEELPPLKLRNGNYFLNFLLLPKDEVKYLIAAHKCSALNILDGINGALPYQV